MDHTIAQESRDHLTSPQESWPTPYVIAIDGPAGAGKSSVSERVAQALGFIRLDTGVIYRAVALEAISAADHPLRGEALDALLERFSVALEGERLKFNHFYADDPCLRSPEVSRAASDYATLPTVRARLLEAQRELASVAPCIVDGRDIGTVVFPNAPLKLFLTASAEERARRRHLELTARGEEADFDQVLAGIVERDRQDSEREIAPLKCADDAQVIDATELTIDEVVARCVSAARDVFV